MWRVANVATNKSEGQNTHPQDENFFLLGLGSNFVLVSVSVDPNSVCADPISDSLDPRPALFFTTDPISTLF